MQTDQGYIVVDSTGKNLRTIASIQPNVDEIEIKRYMGSVSVGIPFAATTVEDVRCDGSVATVVTTLGPETKGSYRVTRIRATGDTVFSKSFSFDGVPIPGAISDSAVTEHMRIMKQSARPGEASAMERQLRAALPRVYPPVSGIRQSIDDETTWIELRSTSEGRPCVIINATGGVVTTVMLPRTNRLAQVSRSGVWTVERDEDGLQSLRRFRMERRP